MKNTIAIALLLMFTPFIEAQNIIKFNDATLKHLVMRDLGITNDTVLESDMKNLKTFVHQSAGISDLSGMGYAVNLTRLDLESNNIKDAGPISGLSELNYLNLSINKITGFSNISELSSLDTLLLGGNEIDDIGSLAAMTTIRYLELSGNKLDKYDLPNLYNLDNLRPILWLRHNGPGFSNREIALLAGNLDHVPFNPDSIKWDLIRTEIEIGYYLRIRGAYIDTLSDGVFNFKDDVYLQRKIGSSGFEKWVDYLYFPSGITLDKTGKLPVIKGSGGVYAFGKQLTSGTFYYAIEGFSLKAKTSGSDVLDGFKVSTGELSLGNSGTEIHWVDQKFSFKNMPFPLDKIFKYIEDTDTESNGEFLHYSVYGVKRFRNNGIIEYSFKFSSVSSFYFGAFSIVEPTVFYDGINKKMGGSFKLKIPGRAGGTPNLGSEKAGETQVVLKDNTGEIVGQTTLENVLKESKSKYFGGAEFLELGMDIEFLNGNIDKLVLSISSDIPIGASGLKITSIKGGLESISSDMTISAKVDIATSVEVPGLGPVVELSDFGIAISPTYKMEGAGTFKIFGNECADGSLKYNARVSAINLHGKLNLGGILVGNVKSTLTGTSFTGIMNATLKTPSDLPWRLKFLSNKTIGAVMASINNEVMEANFMFSDFTIAQRLVFGNQSFPYFHYYIGRNLDNLYKVVKSGQMQFEIPENTLQVMIVAGNDIQLFDYSVTDPLGNEFTKDNTLYHQYADALQTIMVIKKPEKGIWKFNTDQNGEIRLEVMSENPKPRGMFLEPSVRNSPITDIIYDVKDQGDTLIVKLYYDNDNKGYDGVQFYYGQYPQKFTVYDSKRIKTYFSGNFWPFIKNDLPDGEYFIYVSVDDGKNPTIYQYAPGSFYLNYGNFNTVPEGINARYENDTLKVSWDVPNDSTIALTSIFYKASDDEQVIEKNIYDTNFVFLTNLAKGKEYKIWGTFMNGQNYIGPNSDTISWVIKDSVNNNSPYFVLEPDVQWVFAVEDTMQYTLKAFDADDDALVYSLLNDTLGINIQGNKLSWTPDSTQAGMYDILLTVEDEKGGADSLLQQIIVFQKAHFQIEVEFGTAHLQDNQTVPLILKNAIETSQSVFVILSNSRTAAQDTIICMKNSDIDFQGEFFLSHTVPNKSIFDVLPNDTIIARYVFRNKTYSTHMVYEKESGLSVAKVSALLGLKVYPNFNRGHFTAEVSDTQVKDLTIRIVDLNGKLRFSHKLNGRTKINIDISDVPDGLYFVQVYNNKGSQTCKIVVAR